MRQSVHSALICVLSATLGLVSCASNEPDGNEPDGNEDKPFVPIELTRAQQDAVSSTNRFACRLLSESDTKEDNVIQSPLSVATTLSMLASGADGETRDELLSVLGYDDMSTLISCHSILSQRLPQADSKVALNLANSMWLNTGFKIKEPYAMLLRDVFNAVAFNADLHTNQAMNQINEWCANVTNGMIPKLLDAPIDGAFALINAVYFNGRWREKFNKEDTHDGLFTNADGTTSRIPMMRAKTLHLDYADGEYAEAVRLPYGNGAFYMQLVLPHEGNTPENTAAAYASDDFTEPGFTVAAVDLTMPRFSIESRFDLIKPLRNLGAVKAFGPDADYSMITDGKLGINMVSHNAVIQVDEEGSKASAATIIGVDTSAGGSLIELNFNRPFLFFIKEKSTNAVVFSGIVRKI